jgi:hypothetical protein
MRDCNMGLGDKSRRVGAVGAGHGCESESKVVGRRLKKMQKKPFIAVRVTRIAVPSGVKVHRGKLRLTGAAWVSEGEIMLYAQH